MRKVYMTVKIKTMVPIITTVKAIVTMDDGATMAQAARVIATGRNHGLITVEDTGYEDHEVEGIEPIQRDESELAEQITDYVSTSNITSEVIEANVDDSK